MAPIFCFGDQSKKRQMLERSFRGIFVNSSMAHCVGFGVI